MPKYTETEPFEFEGVKVWHNDHGEAVVSRIPVRFGAGYDDAQAMAAHAFVEAERNEWHYTNADKTEARKGRWTVTDGRPQGLPGRWGISNDDLRRDGDGTWCNAVCNPNGGLSKSGLTPSICEVFEGVMTDFLTWHAAQQQPEEPTGWGAVVEVAELEPREPGATECFVCTGKSSHNPTPWALAEDRHIRTNWQHLITRGPVTVLSPGIES